jgi:large subunit ribosomal protein L25
MAETATLATKPRKEHGSSKARGLRRQGRVPGVLYGHKEAVIAMTLDVEELEKALRHGARVVELQVDGKTEQALIHEVQWDHLGKEVLHVDFKRVSKDERVVVNVRLELRGTAPGVTAGGVLDQPLHSLSVEALAVSLPDSIRVSIAEMQIGSMLHAKDIALPPGVTLKTDPEAVVLLVKQPIVEEAAPAAVPAEGAAATAEPEVITRRVAEEPEEEEKK